MVGTIEIDLESDGLTLNAPSIHAPDDHVAEDGSAPQDRPVQSVVLQLPLSRWSVDGD